MSKQHPSHFWFEAHQEVGFVAVPLLTTRATDSHFKMVKFTAQMKILTAWYKKTVWVSVDRFDIHDNCTGVNFFAPHQIQLYKAKQLTNQISRHLFD